MNANPSQPEPSPPVRAEAAAWVARLHSSGRSRALEAGFKQWLDADPAHAQAFEIATEAWEIGGSVPRGALPRIADTCSHRAPPALGRRLLATAAALSIVVVGAVLYFRQPAISTNVGEQRMLTLEDGSRIFLNTDTRLFVEDEPARRHVRLASGEALFDVTKNPARPFVVTVDDKEVVALGTSFVVRRDQGRIAVTLVEGKVTVSSLAAAPHVADSSSRFAEDSSAQSERRDNPGNAPDAHVVTLSPGQRLVLADEQMPQLDEPALEIVTAWRRGEVILDKTRLQDAVAEMNRYSAVKLVIDHPDAADIRVSGIFRAGDSARFARAVGATYHLAVQHEPRRILISGSLN